MADITLVDTHCHLAMDVFGDDLELVIENARQAGVTRVLVPGTDLATSERAINLSERFTEVYAAVGVHPHSASSWIDGDIEHLESLAQHPKVVAIGEIGLDYYRNLSPQPAQIACFRGQLTLARALDLPVIVHNRDAISDVLDILLQWHASLGSDRSRAPGVLHAFSADEESARQAVGNSFYLGIAGPVTFKNAGELRTLVYNLPLDRLLIETDSPFLTPAPRRGQRNEPSNVQWIVHEVAKIRGEDPAVVARITTGNAENLFNWTH